MRIAVAYNGSDHKLADSIKSLLHELGHAILDLDHSPVDADVPDLTYCAGQRILSHDADRAILICGLGICTCIAANKIKGLYAAPCYDKFDAHMARSRYNTNVLCLSSRLTDSQDVHAIVKEWLDTPFEKRSNDLRALKKIESIEGQKLPNSHIIGKATG